MPTVRHVAEKAQVSVATVSRVLNNKPGTINISEETRRKVMQAAEELNYHPHKAARNLRLGKSTKAILFVLPLTIAQMEESPFFPHPFFSHMLHGIELAALRYGHYVSYLTVTPDKNSFFDEILEGEIAGVISWGALDSRNYDLIKKHGIPYIALEPYIHPDGHSYPYIQVDNSGAVKYAVEHLHRLGHRRIAFISARNEAGELPAFRERQRAFFQWIDFYGLDRFDGQTSIELSHSAIGDFEAGAISVESWAQAATKPTAVLAASDLIALGVIKGLHSKGLSVPDDISVVGIDDIDWAQCSYPPLTTVRIPKEPMGQLAVDLLIGAAQAENGVHSIETNLVIRESTKAL